MGFQQAAIKIEREKEFEELRETIVRVFAANAVEKLLKKVQSAGLRIREFEPILDAGVFGQVDKSLDQLKQLYQALAISDRAQMREFYLSKVEEVDQQLRGRYKKIYQYY
jgi:hypothetical protein